MKIRSKIIGFLVVLTTLYLASSAWGLEKKPDLHLLITNQTTDFEINSYNINGNLSNGILVDTFSELNPGGRLKDGVIFKKSAGENEFFTLQVCNLRKSNCGYLRFSTSCAKDESGQCTKQGIGNLSLDEDGKQQCMSNGPGGSQICFTANLHGGKPNYW